MLLVKSRELKNLNKKNSPSSLLASLSLVLLSAYSQPIWAQTGSDSITSMSSILSVVLSLLVVIAIIFALAFVMRRFNVAQSGGGQMRVVASMMAGTKEKVMVIEVGGEQHLLGITAHNINHLATLSNPISNDKTLASQNNQSSAKINFQQKLVNAMAQGIVGNKAKNPKHNASVQGSNINGLKTEGVVHD